MRVAHLHLTKPIHWLVSSSDRVLAPLGYLPGWSVIHPLVHAPTPMESDEPILQLPTGDGRTTVSRHAMHCVVPELENRHPRHDDAFENARKLLTRLRYVSRQATLPGEFDISMFHISEEVQLPKIEFEKPYFGTVHRGDSAFVPTCLTMELVVKAGELPVDFEPPVFEGILLDAMRAVNQYDFRAAVLYGAMAVEVMAGTILDNAYQRLLVVNPAPQHLRVVNAEGGKSRNLREDPIFVYLRRQGKFLESLHELPLYVLRKSLKFDDPTTFEQARKLYQTRNSLAHRGEPCGTNEQFSTDFEGAIDALNCAVKVFEWFGVGDNWHIPFREMVDEWRRRRAGR